MYAAPITARISVVQSVPNSLATARVRSGIEDRGGPVIQLSCQVESVRAARLHATTQQCGITAQRSAERQCSST